MQFSIHNGDALEYVKSLPDNSVDCVLTDPPYFRKVKEEWDNKWATREDFLAWLGLHLDEWRRVLKPNGSLYVFAPTELAAHVEVLIDTRFDVLSSIVWNKKQSHAIKNRKETFRKYIPTSERIIFACQSETKSLAIQKSRYARHIDKLRKLVFEPLKAYINCEWNRAGLNARQANTQTGSLFLSREHEDLRAKYEYLCRPFFLNSEKQYSDVWDFPETEFRSGRHPYEKPQELISHIIDVSTRHGDIILDPFSGSGAIGAAALRLGRSYIGAEIDSGWSQRAHLRLTEIESQMADAKAL